MNRTSILLPCSAAIALAACGHSSAPAGDVRLEPPACLLPPAYAAPPANPLRDAYFGELHLHTRYSMDAYASQLTPRDAYCFATGYPVAMAPYDAAGNSLVAPYRIDRPLDFAAVTDHAEWLGENRLCTDPAVNPVAYNGPECQVWRRDGNNGYIFLFGGWMAFTPATPTLDLSDPQLLLSRTEHHRGPMCGADGSTCREAAKGAWQDVKAQAEAFYRPGLFTTFHAYEYTLSPQSDNLHRNVIFRSAATPDLPVSTYEAPTAPALWKQLDAACTGDCEYLTIPHNSNLANGRMFKQPDAAEDGYDAAERARHEPLIEIFQIKGDSECLRAPNASPDDPLCDFEKLGITNFLEFFLGVPNPTGSAPPETNYVRYGLRQGMLIEEDFGANPFQYGFVADTDNHLAVPGAVDEASYPGHREPPPAVGVKDDAFNNPGGITGIWAEENTRDSLFGALKRRETFGTSGPRIKLRFFGGSADDGGLPADLCARGGEDFARTGYARGVPMGAELPAATRRPRFAAWALADAYARENGRTVAVPLARLQIVKGWVERDAAGNRQTRERVYDVAAGNGDWSLDEGDCSVSGGDAAQLCAVWDDPDFDPAQRAFYYARAVEPPTCRWLTRQCLAAPADLDCSDPPAEWAACCEVRAGAHPRAVQERAWASPIWFKPGR